MPRCVLNKKCLFPNLTLCEGHKCPICLGSVHILCGVKDPECMDLHLNVTCNACVSIVVTVSLQAEMTTQATTDTRKESPKEKMKNNTRKEPPKRKMSKAKKHHQAASRASSNQAEEVCRCAVVSACSGNRDTGSANYEECLFSYR
jgi:mannitol-specific phosphotransferase system IIBC component